MTYADLDDAAQVEVLRPAALAAAARFGLDVARVELVAHAFNTTFRVDARDGTGVALRVHTNSMSTPDNVRAQLAWQRAIADETEVWVPRPLLADEGEWFVRVPCAGYGGEVLVTAATWLDGPDVADPDEAVARALGRTMALLHRHAGAWEPPVGSSLPTFDTPLFGDPDRLSGAEGLDAGGQEVVEEARARCDEAFGRVLRDGQALRALHADLHGGNLKWVDGRLGVFDFDDCGLGVPALDLAIATFYLRAGGAAREAALRAGYAEVAPLPDVDPADLEALVAARQLLLANDLLGSSTRDLRAASRDYLATSVERLRRWLDTGLFTRDPAPGRS
ncbi:phosphotransferase enzyme family protein [Nocardioides coralli]|uniref:phosphotransferase enzyme family protein n=1 Tax=Nocardioides coralli TaxID=2872154 RepID=UPI001CA399A5|nr:phosphotransferase [Nocardioides coralli]QZY29086.1 phosphotransferase [Nocardioides coralli]